MPSASNTATRERLLNAESAADAISRPFLQESYAAANSVADKLPVTVAVAARTLALPFFNRITDDEIAEVINSVDRGD